MGGRKTRPPKFRCGTVTQHGDSAAQVCRRLAVKIAGRVIDATRGRQIVLGLAVVSRYDRLVPWDKTSAGTVDKFQLWIASVLDARITVGDILIYAIASFVVITIIRAIRARAANMAEKRLKAWRRQYGDTEND